MAGVAEQGLVAEWRCCSLDSGIWVSGGDGMTVLRDAEVVVVAGAVVESVVKSVVLEAVLGISRRCSDVFVGELIIMFGTEDKGKRE